MGEGRVAPLELLGVTILVSRTSGRISTIVALATTHARSLIIFAVRGYVSNVILRAGLASVPPGIRLVILAAWTYKQMPTTAECARMSALLVPVRQGSVVLRAL